MTMPSKITELYAWIATGEDGEEGIVGGVTPGIGAHPFIGASRERIESYREEVVETMKLHPEIKVRLACFMIVGNVEELPCLKH